jgi:predicted AlkP superfamily pyrophosphatase or phosphodiesterase
VTASPMKPVLLLNVVGLSSRQIDESTPNLFALAKRGASAPMTSILPAVTMSAQATMLTGKLPTEHGVVGNGWMDPKTQEIAFWKQSNALVDGMKLYEKARALDPKFTCAKLFWWFNMGAAVDWSVTPRPFYAADGRKDFSIYTSPPSYREELEDPLGAFPFFDFWGPRAGLASSRWITDAALVSMERHKPSLTMVYLPHLDYDHQRFGPEAPQSKRALVEVDGLVGELVSAADKFDAETIVVSEYGIEPVSRAIHINRCLREAGLLKVRPGPFGEYLDPFASEAFAVSDHQVAHIYTKSSASKQAALEALQSLSGIDQLLSCDDRASAGLDHANAGDIVAVAEAGAWFTYYYWQGDAQAPDFAPTVDIHRKPGYDPAELFVDPSIKFPKARIANRLARKVIGLRYMMDVIPINAELVRGSHGRLPATPDAGPVFMSSAGFDNCGGAPATGIVEMTSVADRVLALLLREDPAN